MTPKSVVRKWIAAFNHADAAALAALYADNAIHHPVANEPIEGVEAIRAMFEAEFAAAQMECVPENLFEDGEWAILEWRDPTGFRGSGFFHVIDGKIAHQRGYWDRLSFEKLHKA